MDDDGPSDEARAQGVAITYRRGTIEGAECNRCPFAKGGMPVNPVVSIMPEGDPVWIALGEGPGHNEVRTGTPFVGESGQLLNRALREVGRERSSIYIGNATCCLPRSGSDPKLRIEAADACRPRLLRELAEMPPVPILALGAVAAKALLPTRLEKITDLSGTYHSVDVDLTGRPRDIIPTIHPAAILRGGSEVQGAHASEIGYWNLFYDAAKIEALARGKRGIILDLDDLQTEIEIASRARWLVARFYEKAKKAGSFALDLETYVDDPTRHDPRQPFIAKIRALGLVTEGFGISVLWHLLGRGEINLIKMLLADPNITKIGHNVILYDRVVLSNQHYRFKCSEGNWEDTMLMHHAAFPGMSHRLQNVGCQFYAIPPWKSEFRASDETPAQLTDYNAKDTKVTYALPAPLTLWLKRRNTEAVYDMDKAMAYVAGQMHLDGIPVDREVNRELEHVFTTVVEEKLGQIRGVVDERKDAVWDRLSLHQARTKRKKDPDDLRARIAIRRGELERKAAKHGWVFNPNAGAQIIALLQAMGAPLTTMTAKGNISTKASVLEELAHIPIVDSILRYRENEKQNGTFVKPRFDHTNDKGQFRRGDVQPDGRAHPTWSVHKITGRWGSQSNYQNWSKGDPLYCTVCNEPGLIIVGWDAYLHPPINEHKPCPHGGSVIGRSKVRFTGVPNLRAQVRAPDGWTLIGFDESQLEARVIALVSGDPWLCQIFADNKDIHSEFAAAVYPNFWQMDAKVRKKVRDNIKRGEYGAFYEGSLDTIWKAMAVHDPNLKITDVEVMVNMMKAKMPDVTAWKARMMAEAAKPPHELRDFLLGRVRAFPLGMITPSEVINFGIQTAGRVIVSMGLRRLLPKLPKYERNGVRLARPIIDGHDALVFEAREDVVEELGKDIDEAFDQAFTNPANGITVPFPIERDVAKSWALV